MSCHNSLVTLQQTGDGGYILGGSYTPYDRGDDYWVLKLDAAGNKVWEKTIGGYDMDFFTFLQPSGDGGYILGGTSFSEISRDKTQNSNGLSDYWLVKLDAAGDKLWDKTIGADDFDYLRALQPTSDGGYVLGGVSFSGKSGDKTEEAKGYIDYWLVKVDAAGNKQWDRTIGGSEHNELITLQQTSDGGYILGGHSNSPKSGDKSENQKGNNSAYDNFDYWAVKLDSVGNKEWDKTLGGSEGELLLSLQQTFDGGYILGGLSQSPISGNKTQANIRETEFWVVKLAPMPGKEQVKSFTLINTESEQPIRTLRDGDSLDLAALPRKLNIRADTHPDTVGSVLFELSGKQARTQVENELPYALFGDIRGDYEKWYPAPGSYTLRATPYSQPNGQGHAGTPLAIHFTVEPPRIVSFTLINTESEQPIRTLRDGDSLDLAALPRKLNIRADTRPSTVGSVRFELSGPREKIYQDNAMPYALFGDVKGDYNKWYPDPGSYMLSATPYTGRDAGGHGGALLSIRFTVVRNQKTLLAARMEQAAGAARAELAHSLRLYPNPTSDGRLQLQLASQLSGQIRYSLLSAVGRKLAEGTFTNAGTVFSFDFSRQLQAPGLYYLKLEGANMHQVLKIMRR